MAEQVFRIKDYPNISDARLRKVNEIASRYAQNSYNYNSRQFVTSGAYKGALGTWNMNQSNFMEENKVPRSVYAPNIKSGPSARAAGGAG